MAFFINGPIGAKPDAAPVTSPAFPVGAKYRANDGTEWMYVAVPVSTTIIQYAAYAVSSGVATAALTSTLGLRGFALCIAQQAVTSDSVNIQYLWMLVANPLGNTTYKVRVAASCAVDAKLATTANAGTLDDTTAGTVLRVDGIVLTDSQPAGSSGSRTFRTSGVPLGWGAV